MVSLAAMSLEPPSEPERRPRRAAPGPKAVVHSLIHITDTWPDDLPISPAELRAVEAWLGEVLDEVFGPRL